MFRNYLMAIILVLLLSMLQACARYEPFDAGTVLDINDDSSAILEMQEVKVPPPAPDAKMESEYLIGPGDVLRISVPGLIESNGSLEKTQRIQDFRVGTSGKIILPLVGAINVADLSIEEVQNTLVAELETYIKKPIVTVEILEFKSHPLYLLGQFNRPGLFFLDRPTSLLHGLAMGSGLTDSANLRGARLLRDGKLMPVDIYHLLYNNDMHQDVQLRSGDTIYVPGNQEQQVYVFGAVGSPGSVPMINGRLNLLQALSSAKIGTTSGAEPYDDNHVRIIRSLSPTHGQLMVVDLAKIMDGKVMPMPLLDGDIVFVPKTRVGNWNEAIKQVLPTLQLFSGLMQPFVQIEYLQGR